MRHTNNNPVPCTPYSSDKSPLFHASTLALAHSSVLRHAISAESTPAGAIINRRKLFRRTDKVHVAARLDRLHPTGSSHLRKLCPLFLASRPDLWAWREHITARMGASHWPVIWEEEHIDWNMRVHLSLRAVAGKADLMAIATLPAIGAGMIPSSANGPGVVLTGRRRLERGAIVSSMASVPGYVRAAPQ